MASGSRTIDSRSQDSGSAYAVGSSAVSSTTGNFPVSVVRVVLVSSLSSVSKGESGEPGGGIMHSGSVLPSGSCGGMSTTAVNWDWRVGLVVCSP